MNDPLPAPPHWRAVVEDTIERLERRAEAGETFARLALAGWYAELQTITHEEYRDDEPTKRTNASAD